MKTIMKHTIPLLAALLLVPMTGLQADDSALPPTPDLSHTGRITSDFLQLQRVSPNV
jgi:hypothetical protein